MIDPSFWAERRVLISGHTGFKGGWMALWLSRMGAKVTGFALPPDPEPTLFESAQIDDCVRSVFGDVRDLHCLRTLMAEDRPEIVIHLAAQPLVRRSIRQPVETFSTNVMGTVNILDASLHTPSVRAVLVVTSDKCYDSVPAGRSCREGDALGGKDPYSASKACAELVTAAYRDTIVDTDEYPYVATARAGNVIGGGDWAEDRLVPDLVRSFQRGEPAQIRYPEAIRAWQHVLDPLCGYMLLIQRLCDSGGAFTGAWNFAPPEDQACSVRTIADAMARTWGDNARWVTDPGTHPPESPELRLDCTKSSARLGWHARIPVLQAVTLAADWYHAWRAGSDMRRVTERQIEWYCAQSCS